MEPVAMQSSIRIQRDFLAATKRGLEFEPIRRGYVLQVFPHQWTCTISTPAINAYACDALWLHMGVVFAHPCLK
jgi:hypothetical protein